MNQGKILIGALAYEFRMQIRRRAVWITFIALSVLFFGILGRGQRGDGILESLLNFPLSMPVLDVIANWTYNLQAMLPIFVGVLLADRLPRDRRTKMDELFTTLPGALSTRLVGKYLGSMFATLVPVLAMYAVGIGCILYHTQNLLVIPLAIETFAAIALPGLLFISAFSIASTAVLWVPLYMFLYIGYWFWGNLLPPNFLIPSLSQTILTPDGKYMAKSFFGIHTSIAGATPLQGVESILLLVGIAALVMIVLWSFRKWQLAQL